MDQRHRILDAIWDAVKSGEDPDTVAAEYGVTPAAVDAVIREWRPAGDET
jgi:hypothetical protein